MTTLTERLLDHTAGVCGLDVAALADATPAPDGRLFTAADINLIGSLAETRAYLLAAADRGENLDADVRLLLGLDGRS